MNCIFNCLRASIPFALVYSVTSAVLAQTPEKDDDNTRPKTPVVLDYSSVFDDYLPFDDYPDISWKEANDNVGEIGGWRAYLKLVQEEAKRKAEQQSKDDGGDKP